MSEQDNDHCEIVAAADYPGTAKLLEIAVSGLGGARRAGQEKMAEAVTYAMEENRHLAVQAGTGTGKSLAYLVPAIRHAQMNDTTVVVSTATLALQRQLVERDLPRLVESLDGHLEKKPTFAIMKGRSNYLCLNRIAQPVEQPAELLGEDTSPTWLEKQVKQVLDWADETETGDRDDLNIGVSDKVWRSLSVTSAECLGASRCPHGEECFAESARRRAQDVDIVVTNHAMLAIDALSEVDILPQHDVVVVDEAHELDGRITSVATAEVSARALKMAANRAKPLGAEGKDQRLAEQADDLAQAMRDLPEGRWTDIDGQFKGQLVSISEVLHSLRGAIAKGPEGEALQDPETYAERINLTNLVAETTQVIARILDVFATDNAAAHADVVWLERGSSPGTDTIAVAPLSVADMLRDNLFDEQTVVLTSATLALGGRFDVLAASWGLPAGSWDSLDVGTPFEPQKSGILYTAKHLNPPGRDGLSAETLEEMRELIMAAGGRTLGLFSSRKAAEEAAQKLKSKVPFEILVQGEDTIGALVNKFSKNENSCLFGTLTLWQGVDVPGSACSLVMIDRIPFPRPDIPLLQARTEAANAARRSGFMEVSATHAALLMAQGAGRLLRSTSDKGVVAVLDSRLVTKRYGQFLKDSLPPFWETTDPETVRGALRRLVQSPSSPGSAESKKG